MVCHAFVHDLLSLTHAFAIPRICPLQNIQRLIENPKVTESCKLRLVLLYALRYEKSPQNSIVALIDLLQKHGVSERRTAVCFVKGSGSEV